MSPSTDSSAVSPDDTITSVLDELRDRLRELGGVAGIYHLTPPLHSQISRRTVVTHFGMTDEMYRQYVSPEVFESNLVADYVMRRGAILSWEDSLAGVRQGPAQRRFIRTYLSRWLTGGVSIPLFGPNGRDSFSALFFDHPVSPQDEVVQEAAGIAQAAHAKVCQIVERDRRKVSISARENEVLYWVAHGKSNADIAAILGISPGTVDTHVRRLFAKLGVNDRISAVIEGMGRGMVRRK